MICQECGKRPSTLHFTKIVNGDKRELHICESCAREKGELIPGSQAGFSIHNLISGLLDFDTASSNMKGNSHVIKCEECGLTYAQFSKLGRFGCSHCHLQFAGRLDPLLKRVHGNTVHVGKVPKRAGGQLQVKREIDRLKRELQALITREDFEAAAQLRDQIRQLEKEMTG
ncbi:MAG: UvrB/UvrC motif-containing protein [Candidatus Cohnella colombiensis]|uniref:UvrB/UvrC motif-containing protein n=1 Tax=Candidatus Cohnella colombiensis TaxID=3121368 RepID=A0AA95JBA2_9BACL|nr:MAG: UvrB/UvrC motif-containing protein [Cohnella sp.]